MEANHSVIGAKSRGLYTLLTFLVAVIVINLAFISLYSSGAFSSSSSEGSTGNVVLLPQAEIQEQEAVVSDVSFEIISDNSEGKSSNKKSSSKASDYGISDSKNVGQDELYRALQKVIVEQESATKSVSYQQGQKHPDFNENGVVDFPDFIALAQAFGSTSTSSNFNSRYDLVENGAIDFQDFVVFARAFGNEVIIERAYAIINLESPPVNADFNEDGFIVLNLEERVYSSSVLQKPIVQMVKSLDGKTEVSLNGYILTIKGKSGVTGNYEIQVQAGDEDNEPASEVIEGYIHPVVKFDIKVKNSETDKNSFGTFWIYDDEWNLLTSEETDSNGFANVKLDMRVADAGKFIIQGGLGEAEGVVDSGKERIKLSEGWVRTLKDVEAGDSVDIVAVPYGDYSSNPKDFVAYVIESVGDGRPMQVFDFTGDLMKSVKPDSDYDGLKKIIILKNDPFGDEYFTQEQFDYFKQRILDPNDINSLTPEGSFITEDMIYFSDDFEGVDYELGKNFKQEDAVVTTPGVVVVSPDLGRVDATSNTQGATVIIGGVIRLGMRQSPSEGVSTIPPGGIGQSLSHEFGHLFGIPSHPETLHEDSTMTYVSPKSSKVGPADKKLLKIINEKEFMRYPKNLWSRPDWVGNILGSYVGNEDLSITLWGGSEYEYETLVNPLLTDNDF